VNRSDKDISNQLLGIEQWDPVYQERYRKELQKMLEKKLTGARRWVYIFWAAIGTGFTILFGTLAIIARELPVLARVAFAVGAVSGLAWACLAGSIVKRGVFNLKAHPRAMAGLNWGTVVIMMTLFMLIGGKLPDAIKGVQMVVNGLVFLMMAAVFMIFARINQAELSTREKLLEIELRLAEIAEKMSEK
jgi:hypothetical protein